MKTKWIFKRILLILIAIILFGGGVLFKGPPFGSFIARHKASVYANEVYAISSPVDEVVYNLVNSNYIIRFEESGFEIRYDPYRNIIKDELIQKKVNEKLNSDFIRISKEFPESIEFSGMDIFTEIIANGQYENFEDMKLIQKLYILGITNWDTSITIEESLLLPASITREVIDCLGEDYSITGVQIIYLDVNGVLEITDDRSSKLKDNLEENTNRIEDIGTEDEKVISRIRLHEKN